MSEPPQLLNTEPLSDLIRQIDDVRKQLKQNVAAVNQANELVSHTTKSIQDWLANNPTCPACGQEIEESDVFANGGHAHG